MKRFSALLIPIFIAAPLVAQSGLDQSKVLPLSPKTQLEQFQAKTGSVILKGYTEIGSVSGKGSSLTVTAMEFTDAASKAKQFGVVIEVATGEKSNRSYIDLDEVDSLLKGVDYIGRLDKSVTKLSSFEASYSTKGDFTITIFNRSGSNNMDIAIQSGGRFGVQAFFETAELSNIRQLIERAQASLQALK
jgi:hypothetical protein